METTNNLNLPKTDFSQRSNSQSREPELNKFWKNNQVFLNRLKSNTGKTFTLHDGPPYANGDVHMGHVLNKTLKDVVNKFYLMNGYKVNFKPGWDCHGLPTELKALKDGKANSVSELRNKCKEYALKYQQKQKETFEKMGLFGNWDDPYLTMNPQYEAKELEAFGKMYLRGLVYRDQKPVYYSPSTQTVLAEAELEYKERTDKSVYFKFPTNQGFDLLVWTTQPWTLLGNVAVCVNPNFEYVVNEDNLMYASFAMSKFNTEVKKVYKGLNLEGLEYTNPLTGKAGKVVLDGFVETGSGTGLVHLCPAHGEEDFYVCQKNNLQPVLLTNQYGKYLPEFGEYVNLQVFKEGNKKVLSKMKDLDMTFLEEDYTHSYPHDWRTGEPVYYYLTKQFFVNVKTLLKNVSDHLKDVDFNGSQFKNRFLSMLSNRGEWCVSRQRKWGLPLPVFFKNDQVLLNDEILHYVCQLVEKEGSNVWFEKETDDLLPEKYRKQGYVKGTDTLDVWFDSGLSWYSVLNGDVADLYFEGSDQHRGWFQSSLLTSLALNNKAPYKKVLTHGFVLDEKGRKMSKSLGNVVEPKQFQDNLNTDVMRLWCLSVDYTDDVLLGETVMKQMGNTYFKLRNTFRFFLGNLYDYNENEVDLNNLSDKDKKMLDKLEVYKNEMKKTYLGYNFRMLYDLTVNFFSDLSKEYLDLDTKSVLYELPANNVVRRNCQYVLYRLTEDLTTYLAPMVSYLAEDVYQYLKNSGSVFYTKF